MVFILKAVAYEGTTDSLKLALDGGEHSDVLSSWTRLQMTVGRYLEQVEMADEQRDFVMTWLVELPDYTCEEATTQAEAWIAWMNEGGK